MPNIRLFGNKDTRNLRQYPTPNQPPQTGGSSNPSLDKLELLNQNKHKHGKLGALDKRVLSKYLTRQIVLPLINLHTDMERSYWTAFRCGNTMIQQGQKLITTYCKHRACITCNRIRTAQLINGYYPQLKEFDYPQFVTLTRPNVRAYELRAEIESMIKIFSLIMRKAKRIGLSNSALRKIECTYNVRANTFNPHIHVISSNKELSTFILNEWLKRNKNASKRAQDIREADGNSTKELFKYFTKLVHMKYDERMNKSNITVQPYALDRILSAIKGKRTFQTYGSLRLVSEDIEEIQSQDYPELDNEMNVWNYYPIIHNYVSEGGVVLSEINPPDLYNITIE